MQRFKDIQEVKRKKEKKTEEYSTIAADTPCVHFAYQPAQKPEGPWTFA